MSNNLEFGNISFDLPKSQSNVIKVIGVGGGGSNAINHMFKQGIKGVDFIVCNTDSQALQNSSVPFKIQLGANLTEGLGAGANPEVGQQAALESIPEIEKMLDGNTKMVFITAGMGGGTGTGAAPVIAQLAKERDILTVGIVTVPFQFEGKIRHEQAMNGVEKLRKQVDSLIVINNNKLREVYGNLGFKAGFSKADEVLSTASRGIAEVITHHYTQNIDLKDAKTVLSNSGTAIMGSAKAVGENRAKEAIESALDSPLLNDNKIAGAKNVLLLVVSGTNEITIDEIGEINDYIQSEAGYNANIIMGVGEDETLEEAIAVTIIATGFNSEQQKEIVNLEPKRIIHSLEEEQRLVQDLSASNATNIQVNAETVAPQETPIAEVKEERIVFDLIEAEPVVAQVEPVVEPIAPVVINENELIATSEFIKNIDVTFEIVSPLKVEDLTVTQQPQSQNLFTVAQEPVAEVSQPVVTNESTVVFDLSDEVRQIKVNDPVEFVPVTEVGNNGVIRYSLEEYMEIENALLNSQPEVKKAEPVEEELNFTLKVDENQTVTTEKKPEYPIYNSGDVTEMTLEEANKLRAEERRLKLKAFNHKFHNSPSKIDELENEPAYKRSGIELNNDVAQNKTSRMSLGTDSNDDIQLRSNNSFLHDNVD